MQYNAFECDRFIYLFIYNPDKKNSGILVEEFESKNERKTFFSLSYKKQNK